jgi:hypothetical protein
MIYERLSKEEIKELEKFENDLPDDAMDEYVYWH